MELVRLEPKTFFCFSLQFSLKLFLEKFLLFYEITNSVFQLGSIRLSARAVFPNPFLTRQDASVYLHFLAIAGDRSDSELQKKSYEPPLFSAYQRSFAVHNS